MSNIQLRQGDIQVSDKQTLVLPVSCDGRVENVFFRPILLRYPYMWTKFLNICSKGLMVKGKLWLYRHTPNRYVLAFPVRDNILNDYSLEYVQEGLQKFLSTYQEKEITSCAFPILGRAQGVEKLMCEYLSKCDIPLEIYSKNIPLSSTIIPAVEKLCGKLDVAKEIEIKKKICFEEI
nr:hypothetical protein [uncultured Lachnoclostridium sp.]